PKGGASAPLQPPGSGGTSSLPPAGSGAGIAGAPAPKAASASGGQEALGSVADALQAKQSPTQDSAPQVQRGKTYPGVVAEVVSKKLIRVRLSGIPSEPVVDVPIQKLPYPYSQSGHELHAGQQVRIKIDRIDKGRPYGALQAGVG
ncbi:MAG: hypothetical protein ACR2PL_22280, partial [Dehalococcoidia bacterium]